MWNWYLDRVRDSRLRWDIFTYNFAWPSYVAWIDGWIARCAIAIPLVGYLILFNDTVASHLKFDEITNFRSSLLIDTATRLRLIYFGLIFLGLSNALYRWRRPYLMRWGDSQAKYIEWSLQHATISTFIEMNSAIRNSEYDPLTTEGKYYTQQFQTFLDDAEGKIPEDSRLNRNFNQGHWTNSIGKHGSLLRSILIETYFRETRKRRICLITCLFLASIGYLCLAIPSMNLFVAVVNGIIP